MFTKPTGTPTLGFVSAVTRVTANWFNYVSNNFPSIVDGVGGGYYELAGADLAMSSDTRGIVLNFPAAGFPIELRGYVTVGLSDDTNYATGVGGFTCAVPATFTAGVTYSGALVYNNTVTFNNPVTFASGADPVVQSGCAWTFQSGSTFAASGLVTISTTTGSSVTIDSGSSLVLNGTTTLAGDITFSSPHSYTVGPSGVAGFVAADWTPELGGTRYNQVAGSSSAIGWIFHIPAGSVITGGSVLLNPNDSHTNLPADMPLFQLHELNPATGSTTQIFSQVDTSPDVATFEASHTISSAVVSYTVTAGRVIIARVYGEYGTDSQGDGKYEMPIVTFTRTTFAEL